MDHSRLIAAALDPAVILRAQGIDPDPWQRDLLFCRDQQIMLNCSRQSGKSRTVSVLAAHTALFTPGSLVLIVSPGQRQSSEIFRKIIEAINALGRPVKADYETKLGIEFENKSRIICLPGKEETIRCFSSVNLLIIDEAARVPDDVYRIVRPMLVISRGRLIALSTPFGQRGWFFEEWNRESNWKKVKVTWKECPRMTKEYIDDEIRSMGLPWVQQEYECLFTALEGLVYPDFSTCETICTTLPAAGKLIGGIDWGWRNPFAAIWGVLDRDDVLHIQNERYLRETPLHEHAKALPRSNIMWYADPAGRTETEEFRAAGFAIRRGLNDIRLGIAAVQARIRTGRLTVNQFKCPNLLAESKLYRYPSASERVIVGGIRAENPIDEHNHALGALRYLVSRLDSRFIAKLRKRAPESDPLQRLATLGLSVLLPHHPSKGKTIVGQAARGSGVLPSFVDIIIEMGYHSHPDDLDRRRRLTAFSRYSDTPRHLLMELSADGRDYVVLHSGVEAAFGESWQAVLHILSTATFRMTRQEILEQWPEEYARPDATTLWRWLSRAVTEGVVRQTGTGRQHDSFRYWQPTRESMMRPDGGSAGRKRKRDPNTTFLCSSCEAAMSRITLLSSPARPSLKFHRLCAASMNVLAPRDVCRAHDISYTFQRRHDASRKHPCPLADDPRHRRSATSVQGPSIVVRRFGRWRPGCLLV